jgi:hypothetical protein
MLRHVVKLPGDAPFASIARLTDDAMPSLYTRAAREMSVLEKKSTT